MTMQDSELYARILGITDPWRVERVELRMERDEVHVFLGHSPDLRWACPECGTACALHDHQPERQWRHLDTCQLKTILHAEPPRTNCSEHGPRVVKLPWAEPGSRFTLLFEALAIRWLLQTCKSGMLRTMNLSWDEAHAIQRRAVARGMERRKAEPVRHLGADEKSYKKGHKYLTLANDLVRGRVLFVTEGRGKASLDAFWPTLTPEQAGEIRSVSIDMCDAYVASIREHVPDGAEKIVYDKFHIAAHLCEAVDTVRRRENKALLRKDDRRLVNTKWKWLRSGKKISDAEWDALRKADLKTAKAWALKEVAMDMYLHDDESVAREHFAKWHRWAVRSRLKPMVEVAKMLRRRIANILTYFRFRMTNAKSEAINAKVQWVKYSARGFRNVGNFVTAIYFHCGGLNMDPLPSPT
jgi:transposase